MSKMFGTNATLFNRAAMRKYDDLPIPCEGVLITYVWIDGTGIKMRCKDRTLAFVPKDNKDVPICAIDVDCVSLAPITKEKRFLDDVDILDAMLFPQVLYHDPFRRGSHLMALCEAYLSNYQRSGTNNRKSCLESCEKAELEEPWFGFSQEVLLFDNNDKPIAWPHAVQGMSHYAVGADRIVGRDLMEAFYRCCLFAGIKLFGYNPSNAPAHWTFQVGPSPGIRAADDLWMARFLLYRLGEEYGVRVSYNCKDGIGWRGCHCYLYFSTRDMREDDGILQIERAIDLLSQRHKEHMSAYELGSGDKCDDIPIPSRDFTAGVGNRSYCIRIPKQVSEDKKGYFEDRRPFGNSDPYRMIDMMLRTCVFNE